MKLFLAVLVGVFLNISTYAQHFDHSLWTSILQKHVTDNGHVDYKAIKKNPSALNDYLESFSQVSPNASWTKNEKLAFWINAYNAFTIQLIIDNYPVKSIKDIRRPWDQDLINIGNKTMSLNHMEHAILRQMDEPRIHFAIVCASVSCPKLQNQAFTASNLDAQLSKATMEFLSDITKNSISKNRLELSKLFQWFAKDFKQQGSLINFLNQCSQVKISHNATITFKQYNWSLNE